MKYLLDTHTWLWYLRNDTNLSTNAKTIIQDTGNQIFINVASFWEIAIKNSLGKLNLTKPLSIIYSETRQQRFIICPIEEPYILIVNALPFHHNDPFDRMLIAQCKHENLLVLGRDSAFDLYGIKRVW